MARFEAHETSDETPPDQDDRRDYCGRIFHAISQFHFQTSLNIRQKIHKINWR